jgi:hypothetical protein
MAKPDFWDPFIGLTSFPRQRCTELLLTHEEPTIKARFEENETHFTVQLFGILAPKVKQATTRTTIRHYLCLVKFPKGHKYLNWLQGILFFDYFILSSDYASFIVCICCHVLVKVVCKSNG